MTIKDNQGPSRTIKDKQGRSHLRRATRRAARVRLQLHDALLEDRLALASGLELPL
jgi:hypothetical protein